MGTLGISAALKGSKVSFSCGLGSRQNLPETARTPQPLLNPTPAALSLLSFIWCLSELAD